MPDSKIRRVNDDARERIQWPWSTDSYRLNSRLFCITQEQRLNRGRHGGEAFRGLTDCDHWRPAAHMYFSASIYKTSGNLRSSDINSDDELGRRFHLFRILFRRNDLLRQSFQVLGARELYMPPKRNASSPTRSGPAWQHSIGTPHSAFHLRGLSASCSLAFLSYHFFRNFLLPQVHLLRICRLRESRRFLERRYET